MTRPPLTVADARQAAETAIDAAVFDGQELDKGSIRSTLGALEAAVRQEERESFLAIASVARELRRQTECGALHHDKREYHKTGEPCPVLARIDKVMGENL